MPCCLLHRTGLWCAYGVPHGCTACRAACPLGVSGTSVRERHLCLGVADSGLSLSKSHLGSFQLFDPWRARLWAADHTFVEAGFRARLLALPGVGPYAAAHIMMLLGRYTRLILDSYCPPSDCSRMAPCATSGSIGVTQAGSPMADLSPHPVLETLYIHQHCSTVIQPPTPPPQVIL